MASKNAKTMGVRLMNADIEALDQIAERTGQTRNSLIVNAIRELTTLPKQSYIDCVDIPHPLIKNDQESIWNYFLRVTIVDTNGKYNRVMFEEVKESIGGVDEFIKGVSWGIRAADGKWLMQEEHALSRPVRTAPLSLIERCSLAADFTDEDYYEEVFRTAFVDAGTSATCAIPGGKNQAGRWIKV